MQAAPGLNTRHQWFKVLGILEHLKYMKSHFCSLKQSIQKVPGHIHPKQHEGLHQLLYSLLSEAMQYVNMGKERLFVICVEEAVFVFIESKEIGVHYAVAKQDAHTANKGASALSAVGLEFAIMEF